MTLQTVPAYIGETGYQHPVELDRNILESIFGRSGAMRSGDFAIAPTGTAHQFTIAAGSAFLLGSENTTQGGYYAWSEAASTHVLAVPSGSARHDSIVLRVKDSQYGTISGTPSAYWDIVQGVPGAGSARPDSDFAPAGSQYVPGAWWRIANILRGTSDTTIPGGNVTMLPRYVRRSIGQTLCTSTTRPTDAVLGDEGFEADTGLSIAYDGSSWYYTGNYRKTTLLGSNAATVTFSSIPTSLKNLRLTWNARSDTGGIISIRVNGSTSAVYRWQISEDYTVARNNASTIGATAARLSTLPTGATTDWGAGVVDIMGWNLSRTYLTGAHHGGFVSNTSGNSNVANTTWAYAGAGPYTSVSFLLDTGNFVTGSQFTLEGVV